MRVSRIAVVLGLGLFLPGHREIARADGPSEEDTVTWRAEHEARFKSADGWLALVGMYWLREGANSFGTDPSSEILLPNDSSIGHAGTINVSGGQIVIKPARDAQVTVNGKSIDEFALSIDSLLVETDSPDKILVGDRLSLQLVRRSGKPAIRVRDRLSPSIAAFRGKKWFPIKAEYRVEATFTRYAPEKTLRITNIKGEESDSKVPGYVEFTLQGKHCRLEAQTDSPDELFFTFKDATSGDSTYAPGRFLTTATPQDGRVVLDFNRAYNPPCAFSEFTLCPLPPAQNHPDVAIEAGEMKYEPAPRTTSK